jgi:Uma2 family endonuclease
VEDYLAGEESADVKHEYVGGVVYAMAGGSLDHNAICLNLAAALRAHLRGGPCRVFIADVKVRLEHAGNEIFYYPDVMVGCDGRDTDPRFLRHPKVLIEVLSETTERIDRREKFWAYMSIDTLEEYALVAQDRREVTLHRRANGWRAEVVKDAAASLRLVSLDFTLPLAAVYEGVKV